MSKTITVICTWESRHEVEVDDDYQFSEYSADEEWIGEVDSHTAELVGWEL